MQTGTLKIHVFHSNTYIPLEKAKITVIQDKETSNKQNIQDLSTDSSGITSQIELEAPPLENSINPSDKLPYSLCDIIAEVPGYKKLTIKGCQIYPGVESIQYCHLNPIGSRENNIEDIITITENTLLGNYPAKIPESQFPRPNQPPSFYISREKWLNPDTIMVHYGHPKDTNAANHKEDFKYYLKSVLATEINPNWPKEAIKANATAVMSFALNRIFTEWYTAKNKKFHITSSTAVDQACIHGRNTFASIDEVVDDLFTNYIEKPNYEFPLLAQYTDGVNVKTPSGWLSQWGSKHLADRGKTAEEILKFYYSSDIRIRKLKKMGNLTPSYPGFPLQIGSTGEPVKIIQTSLNKIATHYPLIPKSNVDGNLGSVTKKAIETFQGIFNLPKTGTANYATWHKISDIYVGISSREDYTDKFRLTEETSTPSVFIRYSPNILTLTYLDEKY
ncbi:peptidoglycan-binding protein [Clostridium cellulovorans]|uniref:Peptidoglycan-binding domain 1 protein n=1 Tax=Clostridium cellulovorans (strain ATCC 35296 / DSM 3052 / OCM 3 / 743B) TaxID=573061 RepID=D9SSN4_CLOC7|nr:peptidoglycan-binding protein [Clostridium cellulovorans]ADL50631.1 Peptidoglycan-binding domain 1 protein [Clostridium cellulovorans 743B]